MNSWTIDCPAALKSAIHLDITLIAKSVCVSMAGDMCEWSVRTQTLPLTSQQTWMSLLCSPSSFLSILTQHDCRDDGIWSVGMRGFTEYSSSWLLLLSMGINRSYVVLCGAALSERRGTGDPRCEDFTWSEVRGDYVCVGWWCDTWCEYKCKSAFNIND